MQIDDANRHQHNTPIHQSRSQIVANVNQAWSASFTTEWWRWGAGVDLIVLVARYSSLEVYFFEYKLGQGKSA